MASAKASASSSSSTGAQPMRRPGYGQQGTPVRLTCNHFAVTLSRGMDVAQYNVKISYADDPNDKVLVEKGANRRVMDKVRAELGKKLIFDGENTAYVLGDLSFGDKEMEVTLDKAMGASSSSGGPAKKRRADASSYMVRIKFSTKVDLGILMRKEDLHLSRAQDALRVLDVLVREQAARREYVLLRESYFHQSLGPVKDVGEGVESWSGYHASFRPCSLGLSLNLDPSTTIVIKPQLVHEFLAEYFDTSPGGIRADHLTRAKRVLKGIVVQVYTKTRHKIFGFSDEPASSQRFELKEKGADGTFRLNSTTVLQYYQARYNETLQFPNLHCVNVGKATRAVYVPMEFCSILPGQRYKRKLSGNQIRRHLDQARLLPSDRANVINSGITQLLSNSSVELQSLNVKVDSKMMSVQGRVLPAPLLKFGHRDVPVQAGRWNYNRDTVARAALPVKEWIVVCFNRRKNPFSHQDVSRIANQLKECCVQKGMAVENPGLVLVEDPSFSEHPGWERVDMMVAKMRKNNPNPGRRPGFVLCLLPSKESDAYAPFKRLFLTKEGIPNQCIAPQRNPNNQYLTNVVLKMNAKLGGYNTVLTSEFKKELPKLSYAQTMILGMDVSHGSPFSHTPSVAAMVGSFDWPRITRYSARVMAQSAKQEAFANIPSMLESLLKNFKNFQGEKGCYPQQLIVFRDGVSESQFESVLTGELQDIIKVLSFTYPSNAAPSHSFQTCEGLGIRPKITLVVAQKRHHTRFLPVGQQKKNVEPGTVVDRDVAHPTNFDFFLCSHFGMLGTSRPTHYIVLYDEIGFTPDEIQMTINNLCYTYVKSTTAVSVVAPINYAHLAAKKMKNFMSLDGSETGSLSSAATRESAPPAPVLPELQGNVANTMFFV
ncbi:protein argonaute 4A isoform X3 [Selaginella moellendorffii]|uniref:protein argonaute 4A isoform X3 n=1 Tax=Selaginella moellendorffii TaxID=88036 RepID=UPI000D1C38F9|nr:protein argonaute 4A isoform X3 [Selaginella moellendorffii]XP_024534134.1 protein argonaute 4A isoform X3 [Selaginella moellendorffii]|eukprot:XP_024534133.1 protein argonaute 4A isoform X3 [Selaginella moellendorffii]